MDTNASNPNYDFEGDPFGDDSDEPMRDIERRLNVHRLQSEFQEITGVAPAGHQNPDAPSEIIEGFWQSVVEWEKAPDTTQAAQWHRDQAPLPPDAELNDEQLSARLRQIIEWMAARRTYLENTDHLSDRELYRYLRDEAMHEWTKEFSPRSRMNCHISPIGSGSEEDNALYMRYYADDDYRERWARDFPEDHIPERAPLPFDRDRFLPRADYGLYEEDDEDELELE